MTQEDTTLTATVTDETAMDQAAAAASSTEPVATADTATATTATTETEAAAAPADTATVTSTVVDAAPAPITSTVVTAPEATPADTPAQAASAPTLSPAADASGTVTTSTDVPVGTVQTDADILATFATKLAQNELLTLGIADFSSAGKELILGVLESGSDVSKGTIRDLLQYSKEMGPNAPMDHVRGSPKQVALYRTLMNAINNGGNDFPLMFATILRIVYELKETGAFHERFVFRYFPSMSLSKADRDAFSALIHALITLADTSGRGTVMKQIDFNKLTSYGYTDAGKQRLLSFFNM